MNKKLLLIVGALVIIFGLAVFMLMSKGKNTPPQSQTAQTVQTQETQPTVQPKSLKDLLSLGKTQTCSFSNDVNNQTTIFIANNKMRGDFDYKTADKVIKSHIIVDGQNSYIWTDGQTTGYKMTIDKVTENQATNQQSQIDLNKQVNYNCKDWNQDSSIFNLPTGINFTDLSKLIAPTGTTGNSNMCAACDNLQNEAKTQCKTALKCN